MKAYKEFFYFLGILTFGLVVVTLIGCDNAARMLDCTDGCSKEQGPQGLQGPTGPQGVQGLPGLNAPIGAFNIVGVVDPCGDAANVVDEVLLKLANGSVLASFSANANGNNTRLALVPPGHYVTTDGSNCLFSVDAQGNVSF